MSDLDKLKHSIQVMGLELPVEAPEKLLAYRDMLVKWNKTYNLTALRDPLQMLSHHLLDSLVILPWITGPNLLDVGSGAGLPGIPLAIARPELHVTLVDAVQKKTSFQQQVVIELGLNNVEVHHARIEEFTGSYAIITSRAFAELANFVRLTHPLLAPGGRWLAMKGQQPDQELAALPEGIKLAALHPLAVPDIEGARHLVILQPE